ncbi:hypothetical protein L917_02792 [Phytophthora nicotianae]|uniref:Uncharacterized protein n=1 Tax=Phytophthora nicotianae TaxID=4792 RepID=W2LSM9_PHYNI|nr:hypothetical protein L917_02792 [Phytophthora nicotianae]
MGLVLWGVSPFEGNRSDVVPQIGGSDALETKAYYEPGVAPEEHIWEGECLFVRPAKPSTLKQAVGFAIENSSKYGEGAEVNDWMVVPQIRHKNHAHDGPTGLGEIGTL